jgi:hypothetical protein
MKTRQILMSLAVIGALFILSTQAAAASQTVETKGTPPGLVKTPGAAATQKAEKTKETPPGLVKTPGAVATQKAVEKQTEEVGIPKGKHENYRGTITAIDAGSITLALKDGSGVTILLAAETRIKIPGNKEATFADLGTGMKVMVQAIGGQDDQLTARSVVLIPGKPSKTHRVGIVTNYQPGTSITIQAKDGQLYTFLLTNETKVLPDEKADQLQVGVPVTVIAPRDVSSMDQNAAGIVVHPAAAEE